MDILCKRFIKYKSMCVSNQLIIFFTENKMNYKVFNQENHQSVTKRCVDPIQNIQIFEKKIFIFFKKYFKEYCKSSLNVLSEVKRNNIINVFFFNNQNSKFYIKKNEIILIDKNKETTILINKYFIFDDNYLCYITCDVLHIYSQEGKIFEKKLDMNVIDLDIRNKKIYLMSDTKIEGHDLNIYLNDINNNFMPKRFVNLEHEMILYDSEKKELRLYKKNFKKSLFKCRALKFFYSKTNNILIVLNSKYFIIYKRKNEYLVPFKLVDKEIIYLEDEDEFDHSDNSYEDIKNLS